MKRETLKLAAILLLTGMLFTGCAAGGANMNLDLPGGAAFEAYYGQGSVEDIARRVRASMNIGDDGSAVPKVTYTRSLPGDCTKAGCPVGMYRSGNIFILKNLDSRYHTMVLAHELIHHYSRVHGLKMSEEQVIAQTREAGFNVPMYAMR